MADAGSVRVWREFPPVRQIGDVMRNEPLVPSPAVSKELEQAMALMHEKVVATQQFLLTSAAAALPVATQLRMQESSQRYLAAERHLRHVMAGQPCEE